MGKSEPFVTTRSSTKPLRAPVARLAALLGFRACGPSLRSAPFRAFPAVLASSCVPERARPSIPPGVVQSIERSRVVVPGGRSVPTPPRAGAVRASSDEVSFAPLTRTAGSGSPRSLRRRVTPDCKRDGVPPCPWLCRGLRERSSRLLAGSPAMAPARFLVSEPAGRSAALWPGVRGEPLAGEPARLGEGQGRRAA
jgi:hypothetical protein